MYYVKKSWHFLMKCKMIALENVSTPEILIMLRLYVQCIYNSRSIRVYLFSNLQTFEFIEFHIRKIPSHNRHVKILNKISALYRLHSVVVFHLLNINTRTSKYFFFKCESFELFCATIHLYLHLTQLHIKM